LAQSEINYLIEGNIMTYTKTQVSQTSYSNEYHLCGVVKTYSTHERACVYGQVRGASPVTVQGETRWVAEPFYGAKGRMNSYTIVN
jgi:uncharacterized OB-fold protein